MTRRNSQAMRSTTKATTTRRQQAQDRKELQRLLKLSKRRGR